MKQILTQFILSEQKYIEIYFPEIENKFNYYYQPTEKLHKFDEVSITFYYDENEILLYRNILEDGMLRISDRLLEADQELIELPTEIQVGQMVYALNESGKDENSNCFKTVEFHKFWVWSVADIMHGAETFMYTRNGQLYLEIGKIYPWLYDEPDLSDSNFMSYDEFMKNYKPIAVEKISKKTAQQWLEQCNRLIKQIE
jgi:hypothetical protein